MVLNVIRWVLSKPRGQEGAWGRGGGYGNETPRNGKLCCPPRPVLITLVTIIQTLTSIYDVTKREKNKNKNFFPRTSTILGTFYIWRVLGLRYLLTSFAVPAPF